TTSSRTTRRRTGSCSGSTAGRGSRARSPRSRARTRCRRSSRSRLGAELTMALAQSEVTVGSTVTELVGSGTGDREVWLRTVYGDLFFVGTSTVTVADGFPVRGELHLTLASDEA